MTETIGTRTIPFRTCADHWPLVLLIGMWWMAFWDRVWR